MKAVGALIVVILSLPIPARAGWRTFTTADGLAHGLVRGVIEARDETLWFATYGGVSHYDGVRWRTYTTADGLASNQCTCLAEARDGSVWVGTFDAGVTRIHGDTLQTFRASDGLGHNSVFSIMQDRDGRMWFATQGGGVRSYDPITRVWEKLSGLTTDFTLSILQDHAGDLWVGTLNTGAVHLATPWNEYFTTFNGLPSDRVRAIVEDDQHNIWFATDRGVVRRDTSGNLHTFTTDDGLASNDAYGILPDRAGFLWFGSSNKGMSRFDGRWWRRYDELDGYFGGTGVYNVLQDRSGNLWFATSSGAARFDGVEVKTFPEVPGLGTDSVLAVSEDRSRNLWFGTEHSGAFRFDGRDWTRFLEDTGGVGPFEDHAGNRWFPTFGQGIYRLDTTGHWTQFTTANSGLANNTTRIVTEDGNHNIWVSTIAGVSYYDGSQWNSFTVASTSGQIPDNNIFNVFADRGGVIWITTYGGLSRLDSLGAAWRTFTTNDGLSSNRTFWMTQDRDGEYWLSTLDAGLDRFRGNPTPGNVQHFTTANGLRNNYAFGFAQARNGNIWLALDRGGGVMRWDGVEWRGLTSEDGLPSGSCHGIIEDRAGDLWITTNSGVARYGRDVVPPRTVIATPPARVSGSRNQSALFTALGESDRIEYSYRLDGGSWSNWSSLNGWTDQNLPDGMHVLEVRSRDYWLNVDSTAEVSTFEIDATPPAPRIASPAFGQPVRGVVEVRGTANDARFDRYGIAVRLTGSPTWTELVESTSPVTDGPLATWDTSSLSDGSYEIRLAVEDALGLTASAQVTVRVDNQPPFDEQTAPARVVAATGGDIYTLNGELHLYFPPHAFGADARVTIDAVAPGSVPETLPSGAVRVLPGFDVGWQGSTLEKPTRLELSLAGVNQGSLAGPPAIHHSTDGATWERLGGTVEGERITLAVSAGGRYALFAGGASPAGNAALSSLSFTPRVFSPSGTFSDRRVGIAFTLGRPGTVTVRVHDRAGWVVREVAQGLSLGEGSNLVWWDGTDRDGRTVSDGLYLVTVEALGQIQRRALAVVR